MLEQIEPGFFTAEHFEDVREMFLKVFQDNKVDTLYKLRNWREKYHPEFLINGEIYFTKPSELNDPFDIHRPMEFDISCIVSS